MERTKPEPRRPRRASGPSRCWWRTGSPPSRTIEDHHGMGISGDLAADLAEMVVHGGGIADRHDQRRRFARRRADRTKQIGRSETEILGGDRPTAGLPPHPGLA